MKLPGPVRRTLPPPSKEIPVRKLPPLAVAAVALATAAAFAVHARAATADAPTPRERARALVAQLTLDEKIAQLHGIRTTTEFRTVPAIPRLGIPKLLLTNGPAGVSTGGITQPSATALPAPISLAASWDLRQADAYGDIEGAETLSVGRNVLEGPTVNIARVPVNGRTFEGYGEDPYLAARFAVRNIQAIQAHGVIANVKHYFGNNQEADRFSINDDIAERTMREIYLPAFEASVKEATVGSANAGLDLETPTGKFFNSTALRTALQNGQITMATIDDKLVRRYTKMIEFGLFDRTPTITPIPAAEHGRVARKLGAEGIVLLKNANVGAAPVLPLSRASLRSIALIGNDTAKTGGGGSSHVKPLYTVKPSAGLRSRAGSGVTVTVTSGADPTAAAAAARAATVAIVMVEDSESEGHDRTSLALSGNQDALVSAVVAANPRTVVVSKTGGPILMPWVSRVPAILQAWYPGEEDGNAVADVLFGAFNPSGKLPITFPRREIDVTANTTAQYPGIDGTAHYSEGIFVGYRHYDARNIAPLFPFGHGLSYSTYAYSNLKITQGTGANVTVEADVTNTGSRTGAEIVQLYVGSPATAAAPEAPKELQGFQKILLTSGQTGHVSFTLDARSFSFWSTATHRWRIAGGQYRIQLGSSSRDLRLTGTVSLSAA